MSDYFESKSRESAAEALERGLRRDEREHLQRRKIATAIIAASVAGTVLLGGGIAAFAAAHQPAPVKAPAAIVIPATKAKHKAKHKKKTSKSTKTVAASSGK